MSAAPTLPRIFGDASPRKWHDGIVRVLVCDEFSLFRRQLVVALEAAPDIEVMAEAGDTDVALDQVRLLGPDVVFLGAHLPSTGGPRAGSMIRHLLPTAELVLVLDPDDDTPVLRGIQAGVATFVPRESVARHAATIARAAAARRPILTRAAAAAALAEYDRLARSAGSVQQELPAPEPDPRALEALRHLAAGRTYSQAGSELGLDVAATAVLTRNALLALERHARLEIAAASVATRLASG